MKIIIPEYKIERRVRAMAHKISGEHKNSGNNQPPVMICVLNGAFMFFSDLIKDMGIEVEIEFIRAKSYSGQVSKEVKLTKDLELDITGRRVDIFEDMVDTGNTMRFILNKFKDRNPECIKIVTLVNRKTNDFPIDHVCFPDMGDEFYVGYGFDDNGLKRNYRNIYDIRG